MNHSRLSGPRVVVGAILVVLLGAGGVEAVVVCWTWDEYETEQGFFVDPARKTALSLRPSPCSYTDPAEWDYKCDYNCLLQHEDGPIAKIGAFDSAENGGVCRDPMTGLDHALVHVEAGQYAGIQFWSVNPASGEVKQEYEEAWASRDSLVDADGRCLWRERRQARAAFQKGLSALRVGQEADLPFPAGTDAVLPVRAIPAEVVKQQLLAFDGVHPRVRLVKFEAPVYADEAGRAAWRVIQVTGTVPREEWGVVLVEDRRTERWRTLLNYRAQDMIVAGDTLTAGLCTETAELSDSCSSWGAYYGCYEIDLPTNRVTRLEESVCWEIQKRHYDSPDDEKPFDLRKELGVD